jgi:RNA polymerase sigma-70 factor (ECF subfamily)
VSEIAESETPDRHLIDAVLRDRDEGAFRRLYRCHTPRLFKFIKRILAGNEHDAEDVVQETWIRALRRLELFRHDASFFAWLRAIGLNVARGRLRSTSRSAELGLDGELPAPRPRVNPAEQIDLERALELLPDGYRAVVVLHDVEGMTHREIAEALGIAVGTSKSQLFRARSWLQAHFESAQEHGDD